MLSTDLYKCCCYYIFVLESSLGSSRVWRINFLYTLTIMPLLRRGWQRGCTATQLCVSTHFSYSHTILLFWLFTWPDLFLFLTTHSLLTNTLKIFFFFFTSVYHYTKRKKLIESWWIAYPSEELNSRHLGGTQDDANSDTDRSIWFIWLCHIFLEHPGVLLTLIFMSYILNTFLHSSSLRALTINMIVRCQWTQYVYRINLTGLEKNLMAFKSQGK